MSKRKKGESVPEAMFALQVHAAGLPAPERNFRFCADLVGYAPGMRKRLASAGLKDYQLDFAWPDIRVFNGTLRLAVEIDGLVPSAQGGHQSIQGAKRDRDKWLTALRLGWLVLAVEPSQIKSGAVLEVVEDILSESAQNPMSCAWSADLGKVGLG